MSAIGSILSLTSNLHGLPIHQLIETVLKDLRESIKDNDVGFPEVAYEKLNLLTTLLDYESEGNPEPLQTQSTHKNSLKGALDVQLEDIWTWVVEKYFSVVDCNFRHLVKFLIACLRHLPDNDTTRCNNLIQTQVSLAIKALAEGEEKSTASRLIQSSNLVEAFVAPTTFATAMNKHQKSMFSFLCDVILQADETLTESCYHLRMVGLLSDGLGKFQAGEFNGEIYQRVLESFSLKGELVVKSCQEESVSIPVQCCLVFFNLLLDLILKEAVDSDITETKAKTLLSLPVAWLVIQKGLKNPRPAIRKQALYNLRKTLSIVALHSDPLVAYTCNKHDVNISGTMSTIFTWDLDHRDVLDVFWRDFLLLAETLEENQLHVIAPVLKKLYGLISMITSHKDQLGASWICVLLERMISHESKAIIREGVIISLQLDQSTFPFLDQDLGFDFLHDGSKGGLIPALQDVNLFCDFKDNDTPTETTELPVVANHLQEFMLKCMNGYSNPTGFLSFILDSAVKVNWGTVPLYYFCRAVSVLPKFEAWSAQDLKNFQSLMARCSRTHDIRLRHAIQNLLLRCMMKFTNCSKVNLDKVLNVIAISNSKGFFKYFMDLWNEISQWIYQNFNLLSNSPAKNMEETCLFILKKLDRYCASSSQQFEILSFDEIRKHSGTHALLVLAVEQAIFISEGGIGGDFLKHVCLWLNDITEKASTHLYMPKEKVYKAVAILDHLVTAWSELTTLREKKSGTVYNDLFKILKNLLSYVLMRFSSASGGVEEAKFCLDTWRKLFSLLFVLNPNCRWPYQLVMEFSPLMSASWNTYSTFRSDDCSKEEQSWKTALSGIFCLSWICNLAKDFAISLNHNLSISLGEFLSSLDLGGKFALQNFKGDRFRKEVERYSAMMWSCVPFGIQLQKHQTSRKLIDCVQGLQHFLNRLDTVTENNIPTYMRAFGTMITEVFESSGKEYEELICQCIGASWKTVNSLAHSPSFWKAYRSFTAAVFQKSTLSSAGSSPIQEKLSDLLQEIAILSTSKPGLIEYGCKMCFRSWIECSENSEQHVPESQNFLIGKNHRFAVCSECAVNSESAKIHISFIIQCLTFCFVRKKEDVALSNVLKLVEKKNPNQPASIHGSSEHLVSLSAIAMLLQLNPCVKTDQKFCLVVVHELLNLDEVMAKKKSRYHHNSVQHHVKNNIYRAVILLLPFVSADEADKIINFIISALKRDAQPSVRYYMEWALALLILRFGNFQDVLFEQLTDFESSRGLSEVGGGAKFSAICSFLTVALFLGVGKNDPNQETYFLNLINICLPWCMTQHFSIRLYALAVILRIKIYFENIGKLSFLVEKHPALPACLSFADNATGNVARNWTKMKDNFFIFDFHPVEDLSLETVFISIPRLCGLPSDCLMRDLSAVIGGKPEAKNFIFRTGVKVFNGPDRLRLKTTTKWIPQDSKQTVDNFLSQDMRYRKNYAAEDLANDISNLINDGDNVQKKIMPWLDLVESESKDALLRDRPKGLILIASLIDKPSNLGGLTRTCEIFGAEALVVQSLSCASDKLFQSLSVTAHKWLPMKEVKPWQLEEYLHKLRKEGYTLVGTEQTAQSVCLSKYRFPAKCVVLLGNEKEGIPISLLKILDVCVQIPQKGIIRSLNVHVSGAITVWEYARQRLGRE